MFGMYHCKNTEISPNSLVWKFCGNTLFLQSFGRFVSETVRFNKIFTPGNHMKLQYFFQCTL